MITVDERRCAYCGSCVSVCPVDALFLEETHLRVFDNCISCGKCVSACPMGALSISPEDSALPDVSRKAYDLVVVGGGPAGTTAARFAAKAGLSVLLVEKRQEIGTPVQCAEGVGHDQLLPFIEPDPRWISATINKARIIATGQANSESTLEGSGAVGYVLERRVFDRALAEEAVAAGVRVMVKTAATGLLHDDGVVRGVRVDGPSGRGEIAARIVIAADGVESLVGRWAGLDTRLASRDLMTCAQYLLAGLDIDPACTYYYVDEELAPGGYAWIFPKGAGRANVGLGVQADLASMPPREYLNRFIERHPHLAQGSPVCLIAGGVPVSTPPARIVTDGLMLAGDAARQVDPLTGGGIVSGMTAGKLAAEVAVAAIEEGDTSAEYLSRYEARWSAALGRRMVRNYRLRTRFPPGQRSGERFLRVFAMSVGAGK